MTAPKFALKAELKPGSFGIHEALCGKLTRLVPGHLEVRINYKQASLSHRWNVRNVVIKL